MMQAALGAGILASGFLAAYFSRRGALLAAQKPELVERSLGTSQLRRFPWGGEAFEMKLLPLCLLTGSLSLASAVALTAPSGPLSSLELARGPVLVSLFWVWGFFNCVGAQVLSKSAGAQAARVAERALYNTLEQGLPFLSLLWMSAACVDASLASSCGFVYCFFRMFYGFAYSYYGGFSMLCELVTAPNYTVISTYLCWLAYFGFTGGSIFDVVGHSFFVWVPLSLVSSLVFLVVLWNYPAGKAAAEVNLAWNSNK